MEINTNEILKELYKQYNIEQDIEFNETNIDEKIKKNGFLILRYKDMYIKENEKYNELELLYGKLVGQRFDYYKFNYEKTLTKVEIENYYLTQDEKILKMKRILNRQLIKVEFFNMCVKVLEKTGWNMKNFLDMKRMPSI